MSAAQAHEAAGAGTHGSADRGGGDSADRGGGDSADRGGGASAGRGGDSEVRLAGIAGYAMLVLGAVSAVGTLLGFAFDAPIPAPLHHANLAVALLELSLGYGVVRRMRGPWSFAIAAEGVITLVNVLGIPEYLRAKDWVSLGLAGGRGILLVLLVLCAGAIARTRE